MTSERRIAAAELAGLDIEVDRLAGMVAYASPSISWVEVDGGDLVVRFAGPAEELDRLLEQLRDAVGKPRVRARVLGSRTRTCTLQPELLWRALVEAGLVWPLRAGHVGFRGPMLELLEAIDAMLVRVAATLAAEPVRLPAVVPVELLERLGSFDQQPQSLWFAAPLERDIQTITEHTHDPGRATPDRVRERIAAPSCALKTSACCLLYPMLEGTRASAAQLYSVRGTCMRFEGQAVTSLERLSEFTMREIVFVGLEHAAAQFEQLGQRLLTHLLDQLELGGALETASDSFFASSYSRYRVAQLLGGDKIELRISLSAGRPALAVASLNRHRDFFTRRFDIAGDAQQGAVSACLGVGIERLAFALLCHHGLDWQAIHDRVESAARAWEADS